TASDKTKLMYQTCLKATKNSNNSEGLLKLSSSISETLKSVNTKNSDDPICAKKSVCKHFSKALADLHLRSEKTLFSSRILDFVRTGKYKQEKVLSLMQPKFVGGYRQSEKTKNCHLEEDEIDFDDIVYDDKDDHDKKSFSRFHRIAELTQKRVSNSDLKKLVKFEKSLDKYRVDPNDIGKNMKMLEGNSKFYSVAKLNSHFGKILDFNNYLKQLFGKKSSDFDGKNVMVICPTYFSALNKILAEESGRIVKLYAKMSAFVSFNSKFPAVLSKKDQKLFGLKNLFDCAYLTEAALPHSANKMFLNGIELDNKV
ncbi:hypothetical protein MHBO_003918, partial [Bonamia ostreae]